MQKNLQELKVNINDHLRQTSGTGKRRVSFACRFAGMKGSMKNKKGEPTRYAMALKKWGFGSREAARNFCNKNKEK